MWKPFSDSTSLYMLRLDKEDDEYNLQVTDLTEIWSKRFSLANLVNLFKERNPLIQATDDQILGNFLEMIDKLQNVSIRVNITEHLLHLTLNSSCVELAEVDNEETLIYYFKLDLVLDKHQFRDKVTISAIQTIHYLENQQKMLLNLIQKKDRELEEYRMEKGEISRGDLKTDKFDINSLTTNHKALLLDVFTNEGSKDFWDNFTRVNGEIQVNKLHVELEPWNTKPRKRIIHDGKKVVKKGSGVIFKKQ